MVYHSTFVVFLSRDTLKKLSLKRKFCPRFRRGMGSFKEILMPKTIVFGKGELVFFLFHALRVAVGVDPYEPAPGNGEQNVYATRIFDRSRLLSFFLLSKEKFLGREPDCGSPWASTPTNTHRGMANKKCTQLPMTVGCGFRLSPQRIERSVSAGRRGRRPLRIRKLSVGSKMYATSFFGWLRRLSFPAHVRRGRRPRRPVESIAVFERRWAWNPFSFLP